MELKVKNRKGAVIQEDLYGIFFEDINYAADGGLYAEMIENRSFEFLDARGDKDNYDQIQDGLYGWNAYPQEHGAQLALGQENPLRAVNPHYLCVTAAQGQGFTNKAYDGVYIEEGHEYRLTFYARSKDEIAVNACCVMQETQEQVLHFGNVVITSKEWKQYELEFTAGKTVRGALFAFVFEQDGSAEFDFISLFPKDAVCGVFRKDLAEKLKELGPKFVRFPGGCVVEGNELENRYQWKNSVGEVTQRKANWNRWAVHGNCEENHYTSKFSHYNQTLGLGYYEYFLLCEYIGAKPLPVANVGLACQYQSTQLVKRTEAAYQEFIQDVLDLIEFANGASDTKWGSLRAQMGHKEPFGLEMIGIGNEQWQTQQVDFFERYDDFEKAIHKDYPEIKLIGSAGPNVHTPTYEAAWKHFYEKAKTNPEHTYAVDEHYYMEPEWFLNNTHFYDHYARNVKVFAGEYAAHDHEVQESEKKNNWRCALAEAAFLTGVERNADVVYLTSYAPLFARIGYVQWSPDMIWFDDAACYGTPTYYVQKLYREYTGQMTVESELPGGEAQRIFQTVSFDEKQQCLYLKVVNASDKATELSLIYTEQDTGIQMPLLEWADLDSENRARHIWMHAEPEAVNTIHAPEWVSPVNDYLDVTSGTVSLPAYSLHIFVIPFKKKIEIS